MTVHEPTRKRSSPSTDGASADERRSFFGRRDFDLTRDLLAILHFDGTFKDANAALESLLGYERHELAGKHAADCVHPDDWELTREEATRLAAGGPPTRGFENRYRTKSGAWVWLEWTARAATEEGLIYASARDVTARKEREAGRERAAHRDPLTGLANRRGFERTLLRELASANRRESRPALVVLDLNEFKAINDHHGHQRGDEMLVKVAQALESTVRASDMAARIGGDEFAVLLPDADPECAALVARKIVTALQSEQVAARAGVAVLGQRDVADGGALITAADRAMYRAKRSGHALEVHDS